MNSIVYARFKDAAGVKSDFGTAQRGTCRLLRCEYTKDIVIPADAALGAGVVRMYDTNEAGRTAFTVTGGLAAR